MRIHYFLLIGKSLSSLELIFEEDNFRKQKGAI